MTILKNNYLKIFTLFIMVACLYEARAEDCVKEKGEVCVTCCLNKYVNVSPGSDSSPYYPASTEEKPNEAKASAKESDSSDEQNASFAKYDNCRKQCK